MAGRDLRVYVQPEHPEATIQGVLPNGRVSLDQALPAKAPPWPPSESGPARPERADPLPLDSL
jgi:hypothetical protein